MTTSTQQIYTTTTDKPHYMTATATTGKPWDLSQVFDLLNTLDAKPSDPQSIAPRTAVQDFVLAGSHSLPNDSPFSPIDNTDNGGVSLLGDFSRVWEFLGAPPPAPASSRPRNADVNAHEKSPTLQQRMPTKTDYTSDGAVYLTPGKKNIQWRDEVNAGDLTDVAPATKDQAGKLTKTQRKKLRRQERKRLAADTQTSASDFESEAEDQQTRLTPARKASAHPVAADSPSAHSSANARYNLRARDATGKSVTALPENTPVITPSKKPPQAFFEKRDRSRSPIKNPQVSKPEPPDAAPSTPKPKTPIRTDRKASQTAGATAAIPKTPATDSRSKTEDKKEWPVTSFWGQMSRVSSFLPSSVKPSRHTDALQHSCKPNGTLELGQDSPTKGDRNTIKPKIVRTGEDRDWALLLKLTSNFYEDRGHLVKPANLANHSSNPKGIHVFVDASNIFIGFHDQLKRSREIPQHYHVPRVDMSFGALALLMERRRPIAKRVLVGSKPNLNAFDTAREIGYECSILDKVLKARELTERQKYFKQQEERRKNPRSGHCRSGSTSGGDSGLETTTGPVFAPEAFVEQGVDEILHLKMMESLVDTKEPSTMVLATGDAAQAEYSQGFMTMVLRALKAGWKIELVSWSKSINQAYKKAAFRKEWGDQFKIIDLDDYAEELLDM